MCEDRGSVGAANEEIAGDDRPLFYSVVVVDRLLISRRLNGQLPNCEAVLPRENNKVVELDRQFVIAALRRVALLAAERSQDSSDFHRIVQKPVQKATRHRAPLLKVRSFLLFAQKRCNHCGLEACCRPNGYGRSD